MTEADVVEVATGAGGRVTGVVDDGVDAPFVADEAAVEWADIGDVVVELDDGGSPSFVLGILDGLGDRVDDAARVAFAVRVTFAEILDGFDGLGFESDEEWQLRAPMDMTVNRARVMIRFMAFGEPFLWVGFDLLVGHHLIHEHRH